MFANTRTSGTSTQHTEENCENCRKFQVMSKNYLDNTLNSLTSYNAVHGLATLKDDERFRTGHLTRDREHIVKLIVNYLSNKLPIYEKAKNSYTNTYSNRDSNSDCYQDSNHKERSTILVLSKDMTKSTTNVFENVYQAAFNISIFKVILILSLLTLLVTQDRAFYIICLSITIALLLFISNIMVIDLYSKCYISSFNDVNALDKAERWTTVHAIDKLICNDSEVTINISKSTRSLYSRFVHYNYRHVKLSCNVSYMYHTCKRRKRDREPSRLPTSTLKRLNTKSKKLRLLVYHRIRLYTPKSSKLYDYLNIHTRRTAAKQSYTTLARTKGKAADRYWYLFSCNRPISLYKNQSHARDYCQWKLFNDIETNPGPNDKVFVEQRNTISAPYSQGNAIIFGQNAGQQCVAMSLCSLIYYNNHGINSSNDLVKIMSIGDELYTRLSQSAQQSFLLISELPTALNVFNSDYELQYSESYSGSLQQQNVIEGYDYCTSLQSAFQSLISDHFTSFILTIGCTAVAVYCYDNMRFKVFDSHARDQYGRSDVNGTCALLELSSLNNLIQYFQSIHSNDIFEIKGVHINKLQENIPCIDNEIPNFNLSCAIAVYSICYSTMKSCGYWNDSDLSQITNGGKEFLNSLSLNHISPDNIPNMINICGAEVTCMTNYTSNGTLTDSNESKCTLKNMIENNLENSGFMMWFSSSCISCIFKPTKRSKYVYSTLICDPSNTTNVQYTKNVSGTSSLVDTIINITKSWHGIEQKYRLQFLICSCDNIDSNERKRLIKNHKRRLNYNEAEIPRKKILLEDLRKKYQIMDNSKKLQRLAKKSEKYKAMDRDKKQQHLNDRNTKYTQMNGIQKQQILDKKCEKYRMMETNKKEELLNRNKEKYYQDSQNKNLQSCIDRFKILVREGPYYICCVCNRSLYKKSVIKLILNKYPSDSMFNIKESYDGKEYICKTCQSKCIKNAIPCQAIINNLLVDDIPTELDCLRKLEQILIAQRIVFEKIVVMPKGQQRKIKGSICNVPVRCDQTCNILPRPSERSGIIMLKLKRKLQFRGHVYFEAVRPESIQAALNWLKSNNILYKDVSIDCTNINNELTDITSPESNNSLQTSDTNDEASSPASPTADGDLNQDQPLDIDNETRLDEEQDDPLNEYRSPANETCLQSTLPDYPVIIEDNSSNVSTGREIYNVAPGENKHPVSLMTDKLCEELAFPVLFPKGRFGYKAERKIKLSPVKYFNTRLLHYSGRFAMNPEYLFFAQFIIEQKKVSDSINIALKKVHGQHVTASQVKSNIQILQNLISQDQAYLFLRQIPGSPPYWQKFMYEVVAMVKQLGIPTWFMTLSCADLRWPELFQIISRANGKNLSDEEVDALSYDEKCRLINLNPVITAKHFQYRVETFFTEILLTNVNPIGKIVYYALRIEFQMRGSPHLHALIWTSDCPKLSHDTKDAYIDYIDQHVQAYLPNKETDPELYELVKKYQTHSHSKTCRKYKNIACRFNFGQFFTDRTIVSEPLPDDMDEELKTNTLNRCKEILSLVKQKIDAVLNPSKPDYNPSLTQEDILTDVGITKQEYESALSVSPDSDYGLHLKRPLDSCFTNNYFIAGIKGFAANVDLQPIFNHYKCITYVCSYFTKDETECSQAIVNAAREAREANLNIRDGLKKIGAAFLSSREVSSQESVYRCMPELWLRKIYPKTVFVSTDMPERRLRVAKSQQELDDLDDDSTDIYKSNIIERYSIRPNYIQSVNNMCLAEFASFYYKDYRADISETADAQPEVLSDDIIEQSHIDNNDDTTMLPNKIRLMNGNEVMKCRKVKAIIRYHTPNKTKEPEKYFHHLLMLYYPWRDETELIGDQQTYMSKFSEPNVQSLVEKNRNVFEPDSDAVIEALETLRNNNMSTIHSYDPINDQENEDLQSQLPQDNSSEESFNNLPPEHLGNINNSNDSPAISTYIQPSDISDDDLRHSVRSLNTEQRKAYNTVLTWCRNKVKNMNSIKPEKVDPIYIYISGSGGTGKSHLIRNLYHTATKTFRHGQSNAEKPTVLLMAPTGVAAININGTTIHTALAIPKEAGENVPPMSDQKRTQIRISLSELKLIIIDEISMVSNTTLLHIHQRLKDIFATPNDQLYAGLSIIVVGDLYQLPPIRRKPVFDEYKNNIFNLCHPWSVFEMVELTEIMRQKDDQPFIELLNRLRTASQTDDDLQVIQSRVLTSNQTDYPTQALHIFAENAPVDQHNKMHLEQLNEPLYRLIAIDQYPQHVSKQDIDRVLARGRSETGGLDSEILIKVNSRVMLTTNIDISDRLINGQMGTVTKVAINRNTNKPSVIYIKFDDSQAGINAIQKHPDQYARETSSVPLVPVLARIKVRPGKPSSPELQRLQFPLTLAWACTVHKVQGLTLDEIVVSFDLNRQTYFNYGQIYVALSRARSLQGLHVIGQIENKHVRANPKVNTEYERMRQMHNTDMDWTASKADNNHVTISLLNIRSLRKHSIDIKHDVRITMSDIIALTETQLLPHHSDNSIRDILQPYELYRQDHPTDKYLSLAVCTKPTIAVSNTQYFPVINGWKLETIQTHTDKSIVFLLIYRKNNCNTTQYLENLRQIIQNNNIQIILGDFNINYYTDTSLKSLMNSLGYIQIINKPTFVSSGSLLDHVYVQQSINSKVISTVTSVYYSDHDSIQVKIVI